MSEPAGEVCAIVPYRADTDGFRRRNAEVVLRWLAGGNVRTILAEHSEAPDDGLSLPVLATRIHVPSDGRPFNKALACNTAVRQADAPVIALVDADTITSMPAFRRCVDAVREEYDVVRPFGRLVDLDEATTQAVVNGAALPEMERGARDDDRSGEHIPICGGIVVMRADAYRRAGGMDESFQGWGGEDTALAAALVRSQTKRAVLTSAVAFHLHHPRTPDSRYLHADYAANHARARWWNEGPDEEIEHAIRAGAKRF